MPEPVLGYFSDSHVDIETWTGRPIRGDSMFAWQYVFNFARRRKLTKLIGGGDLLDVRRPPSEVVDFLIHELGSSGAEGIRLHFIQGQHEYATPPWLSAIAPDCTTWLHKKSVRIGEVVVYGLDWTPADKLAEELAAIPDTTDIFVCHQVWEEFMGDITSPEGSLTQIPNAGTVFTGDYHQYVHLKPEDSKLRGAGNQKLNVYSAGATCMRKIDEPKEHYMLVLYSDGTIKRKQIPSRPVYRYNISGILQLEKCISDWKKFNREVDPELPEALHMPLLHVTYPEEMPEIRSRMEDCYCNLAHLFWKAKPTETEETVRRRAAGRELREKGPAGCLSLVVPEADPRHAPLLRLLNAADKKAELVAMKKERNL